MNKSTNHLINHPLSANDANATNTIKQQTAAFKGQLLSPEQRADYDNMLEQTPAASEVVYEDGVVGGVRGVWCYPTESKDGVVMLYLHGGGYIVGSAKAYRNFVGNIAAQAGVKAFIADYRLAPESVFPAAIHDAQNAYYGLINEYGAKQIIISGDSAGGGLSLVLLAEVQSAAREGKGFPPSAVITISPWTDLALTGESMESKAEAELYLTKSAVEKFRGLYQGSATADFRDPLYSPLYGDLTGFPPLQLHVGTSEILLDDTLRYVERAVSAGVDASAHVWEGMPHVFVSGIGVFEAASKSLEIISKFINHNLK